MSALAEAAAQMGDQHLAYRSLITYQLHQLIDTILLQQIFCPLLLQCEASVEKGESGTLAAPGFGFPAQPTLLLHGVQQGAHMAARTAE